MLLFILQVLAVAVYNHYKRIYHASQQKGLVFTKEFILPILCAPKITDLRQWFSSLLQLFLDFYLIEQTAGFLY